MRVIHKRKDDLALDNKAIHVIDTIDTPNTRVDILVGSKRYTIEESEGNLRIYSLSGDILVASKARNAIELYSKGL